MGFKLAEGKGLREGWDSRELWKSVEKSKAEEVNPVNSEQSTVESKDAWRSSTGKQGAATRSGWTPPARMGSVCAVEEFASAECSRLQCLL